MAVSRELFALLIASGCLILLLAVAEYPSYSDRIGGFATGETKLGQQIERVLPLILVSPLLEPGGDFSFSPSTPLTGQNVTFTATVSGGTPPYAFSWSFGDGTTGTGNPATHTYAVKGSLSVVLTVSDASMATQTVTKNLTVFGTALVADFTFTPASPLAGQTVTFTATASGDTAPYAFSWSFGDSTTGTGNPRTHIYAAKGAFTVVLTVTDANAVTQIVTKTVSVSSTSLVADFTFGPGSPAVGEPVTFTATVSGGTMPYFFSWSFGDGTAKQTGNPTSHTYATIGSRTVTVSITDANGATQIVTKTVFVCSCPIIVDFTFSPASPTTGKAVTFTATVSGGTAPYTFSWSFGDGTPKQTGNPTSHTFATKGSQTVQLNVTDARTRLSTVTKTLVVVGQPVVADFTFAPAPPLPGQSVTFTATVSGGTAPYSFTWNFGDGTPAGTGNPVSHTYTSKATRTVVLTVTDANTASNQVTKSVGVNPTPLIGDFTYSPASPTAGKAVTFTATASGDTAPYSFSWNFGDGTPAGTGSPVSHTYATKGSKTVTLTITSANSANAPVTKTVAVGQPVAADFTFSPASPQAGQSVTFTATASGGTSPYAFSWNFGDGTPAGSGNPVSHTYTVKGMFTITLTVTDANAATKTASHTVAVSPMPVVVDFASSPASPVVGQTVTFTATASGGTNPYMFAWNFGDSTTGTGNPVTHSYGAAGAYSVSVTVTDANGAMAVASHSVTPGPGAPGAPTACFTAAANKKGQVIGIGIATKFDGKCSTAADGKTIVEYDWTFGDGSFSNGTLPKVTHAYAVNGTYAVTLTVKDTTGLIDFTSQTIQVKPAPIVDSILFNRNLHASERLTQTWTVNLINPNSFPIHVNVEITGTADTVGAFSVQSGPLLLPVGLSITPIVLSKDFTAFDVGLTYNFQVKVTFTGNGSQDTKAYQLGAIQTDYFRIRA